MENDQLRHRNRGENLVVNHRIGDEINFERNQNADHNHQQPNVRNQVDNAIWQAAAVANVAGDSLQIRSRKWDKIIDMLLRLPFMFLLDQILLQDMGWNGLNNLHKSNFSSQVNLLEINIELLMKNVKFLRDRYYLLFTKIVLF